MSRPVSPSLRTSLTGSWMRFASMRKTVAACCRRVRDNVDAGSRASSNQITCISCPLAKAASFSQSIEVMLSIQGVEPSIGQSSESSDREVSLPLSTNEGNKSWCTCLANGTQTLPTPRSSLRDRRYLCHGAIMSELMERSTTVTCRSLITSRPV